jgi:hypothetical protein
MNDGGETQRVFRHCEYCAKSVRKKKREEKQDVCGVFMQGCYANDLSRGMSYDTPPVKPCVIFIAYAIVQGDFHLFQVSTS